MLGADVTLPDSIASAVGALTAVLEMAPHGIRLNAICPGLIVETAMRAAIDVEIGRRGLLQIKDREKSIPLGRIGYPDDAAYVTGTAYDITGGTWMR